jgi:hypothetical protein
MMMIHLFTGLDFLGLRAKVAVADAVAVAFAKFWIQT